MLVSRLRREERGGVLALSAILIPLFIVMTAMVVDVGQWYTHKRQLQTRADAGAFAAGIEYGDVWKACVYSGSDPGLLAAKAAAARTIANRARQYAADPETADYAPDPLPATLYNQNIANQSKLDVVVNSTTYTNNTDYSDGGGTAGNPCFVHSGDNISPGGGHWADVRVKENDLPSIFGSIGVPLSRNTARARVEIRPALSGNKFLPLAVPNNVITKVQVRYYNECTNPPTQIPNSTFDLKPLPAGDQAAFISAGGGTLWGLPSLTTPAEGDSSRSLPITLPTYGGCGQPYLPVGMEVRLTSSDSVDINQSCQALITAKFADCFHRLSQIRVWNDGTGVRVRDVRLTGGCAGGLGDAYFGPLPVAATDCRFGANVDVFWGTMDDNELAVSTNFHVTVNGVAASPPGPTTPSGVWTVPSGTLTANPGANDVTVQVSWTDTTTGHIWEQGGGACRNGSQNPCRYSGPSEAVHRTFVGTTLTAGAVAMAHTSAQGFVGGVPGPSYATVGDGGNVLDVHPTVGIKSVLKTGILTTIRLDDPQANQALRCDPNFAQGQEFSAFRFGCQPWYAKNTFTNGPWWNTTTKQCPQRDQFFSYNTMPAPYGLNTRANPWQCVPLAPGFSVGQVGDNIGVATENCGNISNNSCSGPMQCNYVGNYDGIPGTPTGWAQGNSLPKGSKYPRVVNLFIIPYQSLKGATGADPQETVPVLTFASFYVFNWTTQNNQQSDPCPDRDFDHDRNTSTPQIPVPDPPRGAITGVFVETVDYESGPVDPTAICVEGQLESCRASLVR
jgi:hypothetical protein